MILKCFNRYEIGDSYFNEVFEWKMEPCRREELSKKWRSQRLNIKHGKGFEKNKYTSVHNFGGNYVSKY
ncbi:hypothetical protein JXA27_06630 [Aerococcaceae bacterium zg-B36]|uniref:hypothetical protein n=1 Tax=Aerococcaceae bacterium zg-252 TaxID=2796928 RepID=UPI001BD88A04|nr:hypothetical protein [Aerococcaceae bacterium zg-B36]